jgi:DNA repair exonuclease SbcCD nuclease subunit
MTVAIITDTHYGIRNDHQAFLDNQKRFFDEVFFPKIDELGIKRVIHLGDLVDRRKYVNYVTARRLRKDFLEPMAERDLEVDFLLGNHDTYFKETNSVNALQELLEDRYPKMKIFDTATEVENVLYVPWICAANHDHTMKMIQDTKAQICMGHLDLKGFEMYRGVVHNEGLDPSIFAKFDQTFSGHFHHKSESGGIHYLGAANEQNWSDYNDARGFHTFDMQTRDLVFHSNPFRMFEKILYTDSDNDALVEKDIPDVKNKFIKIVVRQKNSAEAFDMFIDQLEKQGPLQIQIVDDHLNLDMNEDENIIDEAEDTLTIFRKAINQSNNVGVDIDRLNQFITELYNEALSVE